MKKIMGYVGEVLVLVYLIGAMVLGGWLDTHYTAIMTVVSINDDTITLEDWNNNFWNFKGTNFSINDKVKVTLFDNTTTHNIYDDEIVKVKKVSSN